VATGDGTFITVAEVRAFSGVPEALMDGTAVGVVIAQKEKDVSKWLNTKFVPTTMIEFLDGTGNEIIYTSKNPLLAVRSLEIDSSSIDLDDIFISKPSGKIELKSSASTYVFVSKRQSTIIKYLYGYLEESSTSTTTDADSTAGTSVALSVASESNFSEDEWIEIYGTDGYREVAKITGTDTGELTVDQLVLTHESGSTVVKLEIPAHIKTYMIMESVINVALNAIGATYTFNASYNIGEFSVVKGVPYTHWRESLEKAIKIRDDIRKKIKIRPSIMM